MVASVIARRVAEGLEGMQEQTWTRRSSGRQESVGWRQALLRLQVAERKDSDGHGVWSPGRHASRSADVVGDKVLAGPVSQIHRQRIEHSGRVYRRLTTYGTVRVNRLRAPSGRNATIRQLLKSETLLGYATHNGKTLRDEGMTTDSQSARVDLAGEVRPSSDCARCLVPSRCPTA